MSAKNIIVALTGTIGAGKSSVAEIWGLLGAQIISADKLSRQLTNSGNPALVELRAVIGDGFFNSDGTLNRTALANAIFSNPKLKRLVEDQLHPKIRELFSEAVSDIVSKGFEGLIIYEVPLLFESGQISPQIKYTVTVSAPKSECLSRIMKRDSISLKEAEQRIASQLDQAIKEKMADFVICNDGDLESLKIKVNELDQKIKSYHKNN